MLRDGADFRPKSAPDTLLLENHFYQPFSHPTETSAHPNTAPHTPTELEQELERARSEERSNCDLKENVAEGEISYARSDLRTRIQTFLRRNRVLSVKKKIFRNVELRRTRNELTKILLQDRRRGVPY